MNTTEDARTWARRLVEETLVEAGLVAPSETSRALPEDEGPPPPPSLARQAAHRIVEAVQREHEAAAASRANSTAATHDHAPPDDADVGGDAADVASGAAEGDATEVDQAEARQVGAASNGHHGARADDSEAANRARRIVADVLAAEEQRLAAVNAEEAKRAAEEAEQARLAAEEAEEAKRAAEESERARLAAEEAEEARRAEEAAAQTSELPLSTETTAEMTAGSAAGPELFTQPSPETEPPPEPTVPTEPELFTEPLPGTELDFDPDADPGLAFEPEGDARTQVSVPPTMPTASVDLLPAEPTETPHPGQAEPPTHDHPDETTAELALEHPEAPAPEGPVLEGPPPPPLAMIDGWWQRFRSRHRRRQAMAEWAPDAARAPRRTGRWLLVTIVAVVAITLLFPMAVDALRQLVAL